MMKIVEKKEAIRDRPLNIILFDILWNLLVSFTFLWLNYLKSLTHSFVDCSL